MVTRVLLLGSGGREHAWAIALKKSDIELISWAPQVNPGIRVLSTQVIKEEYTTQPELPGNIDLAVVGPEDALIAGVTDWLESLGIPVFGPTKANARLEGSKSYMREIMTRYQIDGNIDYTICRSKEDIYNALEENYEVAVKPDGLTGGKGVFVYGDHLKDRGEVKNYANLILERDGIVLLEELLIGSEFTLQGFVNGAQLVFLPLIQDYKRAFDNDIGPNTGSMGSISFPNHLHPMLSDEDLEKAQKIVSHVARSVSMENGPYRGAIYGQFMLTHQGPKIVEFNARLGDPEAIIALELLETPVMDVIMQLLDDETVPDVHFSHDAACCVYLVPEGYPSDPEVGLPIKLNKVLDELRISSVEENDTGIVTTNERSLAVLGRGPTLEKARKDAYDHLPQVPGLWSRSDIGRMDPPKTTKQISRQ
ncbi:MAG: phosphoribosylamine--glycine ligase [Candidatus Kariarchaeaceae archaeon]|jgi:phosphoribosylamine--glycine ligase